MDDAYRARVAAIGRELGVPANYAERMRLHNEAHGTQEAGKDIHGRVLRLAPQAAEAWRAMRDAAAKDHVVLQTVSGFRSVRYQQGLINAKLARGQRIGDILRVNTAPGYSEHHTGCALDLATPDAPVLEPAFADSAAYRWLRENAGRFGFSLSYPEGNTDGIDFEPWHWRYAPPTTAAVQPQPPPQP